MKAKKEVQIAAQIKLAEDRLNQFNQSDLNENFQVKKLLQLNKSYRNGLQISKINKFRVIEILK